MVHSTKTTRPIKASEINRSWHLVDMKGKILGREVPHISTLLQGKHKTSYTPYLDMGDCVVVINAKEIMVTGKKAKEKTYTYYSGYPSGLRTITFNKLLEKNPAEIIHHAVVGMLPKNKLRDRRMARLFIFPGEEHPYADKIAKKA